MNNTLKQAYLLYKHYRKKKTNQIDKYNIRHILKELNSKGYYVIENYFDNETCNELVKEIDLLHKDTEKIKFDSNSNDFRLNGADRISLKVKSFADDKYLLAIANTFLKEPTACFFTLAAKIESKKNSLGSGGDWHRDITLPDQFKSMIYLCDVSEENGPFEYLENSNKALSLIDMTINFGLEHSQNRLTNKIVSEKILRKKRYKSVDFKAKKGTLILFNSFGIHRGKPLNSGNRYALTNYYFPKAYIQKNIKYLTEKFKLPNEK